MSIVSCKPGVSSRTNRANDHCAGTTKKGQKRARPLETRLLLFPLSTERLAWECLWNGHSFVFYSTGVCDCGKWFQRCPWCYQSRRQLRVFIDGLDHVLTFKERVVTRGTVAEGVRVKDGQTFICTFERPKGFELDDLVEETGAYRESTATPETSVACRPEFPVRSTRSRAGLTSGCYWSGRGRSRYTCVCMSESTKAWRKGRASFREIHR
jgi:hypothetical protein